MLRVQMMHQSLRLREKRTALTIMKIVLLVHLLVLFLPPILIMEVVFLTLSPVVMMMGILQSILQQGLLRLVKLELMPLRMILKHLPIAILLS